MPRQRSDTPTLGSHANGLLCTILGQAVRDELLQGHVENRITADV